MQNEVGTKYFWGCNTTWSAANGGLRDGGLRKSEDIRGKRPFSSVFWISQVLLAPSGKGRKRQKKGDFGRFWPISRKGGQTPLKPPFVTPPFAAAQKIPYKKGSEIFPKMYMPSFAQSRMLRKWINRNADKT